jgi:dTDP-4-dehydrorhamnose 3,5-epimerase
VKLTTTRLAIPDVVLLEHETFEDARGYFMEVYKSGQFGELGLPDAFVQMNESCSARNVIRGLHFQWDPPMGKLMRVAHGAAFVVAVDITGFARGLCALEENTRVQYLCTGTYNGATESGLRWDDSEIAVAWPVSDPLVSDKDRHAQTLREWLARPEARNFSV